MKFLRKEKIEKTIIIISDIHLGAGDYINGHRNYLEDFHYDEDFIEFLNYFSSGTFSNREVELIINGDFFDLLAVPYVEYYDDEFWSEEASLKKLEIILDAHKEVIDALSIFLEKKNKTISLLIGNHDAELVFESLRDLVLSRIKESVKDRFFILSDIEGIYRPHDGVVIKHGHEYEFAHIFNEKDSVIENVDGRKYFLPPWGSYYVTRVINKFKEERSHVNAVKPIYKFLVNGMIYDTFFTLRFILANIFYFVMVRTIYLLKQSKNLKDWLAHCSKELELFHNLETLIYDQLQNDSETQVVVVGHTHEPACKTYANGKTFINTGTWTRMYHLDFGKGGSSEILTFAKIDVFNKEGKESIRPQLHTWKGVNQLPYNNFN